MTSVFFNADGRNAAAHCHYIGVFFYRLPRRSGIRNYMHVYTLGVKSAAERCGVRGEMLLYSMAEELSVDNKLLIHLVHERPVLWDKTLRLLSQETKCRTLQLRLSFD